MQIELSQPYAEDGVPAEVWVRVRSHGVVDWPRVEAALDDTQRRTLNGINPRELKQYYPHHVSPDERAEHGYKYEEFWVFTSMRGPKR